MHLLSNQDDQQAPSLLVFLVPPVWRNILFVFRLPKSRFMLGKKKMWCFYPYISSLWSREPHHSRLSTRSQRARWAGATVLTRGPLSQPQKHKSTTRKKLIYSLLFIKIYKH